MFEAAVELLPLVSPRNLGRQDHEYALSQFGQLASTAAAIMVQDFQHTLDSIVH